MYKFKVISINEKKPLCLPNKENIIYHGVTRTNKVAKFKYVTVPLHLIDICKYKNEYQTRNTSVIIDVKEQIWLSNVIYSSKVMQL